MGITIIAGVASNGIIGQNNAMPWHVPEDFAHFKRSTLGKTVIMGRKTFDSLGRPLPKRTNVVVSRTAQTTPGVEWSTDLKGVLEAAHGASEEIFLIGGTELWAYALEHKLVDSLLISHMKFEAEGDAFFPPVDWAQWKSTLVDDYPEFTVKRYTL